MPRRVFLGSTIAALLPRRKRKAYAYMLDEWNGAKWIETQHLVAEWSYAKAIKACGCRATYHGAIFRRPMIYRLGRDVSHYFRPRYA